MSFNKVCLLLLILALLGGCYETKQPDNVVATVNGKPITLHTVQSLQEIEFIDFNDHGKPSLEKLRKQYGATLSTIILYEIILQFIEKQGFAITDAQVDAYEKELLIGYPADEFANYVTEQAINVDTWRILLRYQLAIMRFKDDFLSKEYVPSVEDVQAYYDEHRAMFMLEPSYTLHIASSEDKDSLVDIDNIQNLLDKNALIQQYSLTTKESVMPSNSKKAILRLKEGECTDIIQEEDLFSRFCLVSKNKKQEISISKAYTYIEDRLTEQRLGELLYAWLERNTKDVEVKVSKHLIDDIM